ACTNKPANSSYTSAGNGGNNCSWTCNSGYTKKGDNCCANAPANATLNTNDCGWTCNSGYSKNGSLCCSGTLPENATYSSTSSCTSWTCKSGYDKVVADGNSVCTKSACTPSSNQFKVGTGADAVCCANNITYTVNEWYQAGSTGMTKGTSTSLSTSSFFATQKTATSYRFSWYYNGKNYAYDLGSASNTSQTNNEFSKLDTSVIRVYVCGTNLVLLDASFNKLKTVNATVK
ncbi:hypothetical protein HDR60_00280, partial [bacterium]|nr:hypothetical protein [bacterium]